MVEKKEEEKEGEGAAYNERDHGVRRMLAEVRRALSLSHETRGQPEPTTALASGRRSKQD